MREWRCENYTTTEVRMKALLKPFRIVSISATSVNLFNSFWIAGLRRSNDRVHHYPSIAVVLSCPSAYVNNPVRGSSVKSATPGSGHGLKSRKQIGSDDFDFLPFSEAQSIRQGTQRFPISTTVRLYTGETWREQDQQPGPGPRESWASGQLSAVAKSAGVSPATQLRRLAERTQNTAW